MWRVLLPAVVCLGAAACGIADILDTGTSSSTSATNAADASTDGPTTGAPQGVSCGLDNSTGVSLCRSISTCPAVVVDSEAYPHCGFRIRGAAVDLVCGCGDSICSMGAYTTCAQAQQLLTNQTEQSVCVQVAEDRCTKQTPPPTSSSSGSTCDRQCLSECGGGAACAGVCGC